MKMKKMDKTVQLQPALNSTKLLDKGLVLGDNSPKTIDDWFGQVLPSWESKHNLKGINNNSPIITNGSRRTEATSEYTPDPNQPYNKFKNNCSSYEVSIENQPKKIVEFTPNASVLWLGALVQGRGIEKGISSLAPLNFGTRSNLGITCNDLVAANSIIVNNPSNTTVNDGIKTILRQAIASNFKNGFKTYFNLIETSSFENVLANMGLSCTYAGFQAKLDATILNSSVKKSYIAYFNQEAFTFSIDIPQKPSAFFAPSVTIKDLNDQMNLGNINDNNLPVCISSITYGRILMVKITSANSKDSITTALNASYDGTFTAKGYFNSNYQKILNESQFEVVAIGGPTAGVESLIKSGHLNDYFAVPADLSVYKPLFYEFINLGNNSPARYLESTKYTITECTPVPITRTPIGANASLEIKSIKVIGVWDWRVLDDRKIDLYGNLAVDGNNAWAVDLNGDIFSTNYTFKNGANNYGDGELVSLDMSTNKMMDKFKKDLKLDSDEFRITGKFGNFDPAPGIPYEMTFDIHVPYAQIKNASLYGVTQTYTVANTNAADAGHPCGIEIQYVVNKVKDLY
jgi:hypothetical protein